ncbi:MAG TPA: hypothetical protein IAC25_01450 [Candidatus Enterenecus stercoripullorum]|nr:hypothetical protein [Candidatus Enterenecus stercoripullorum]
MAAQSEAKWESVMQNLRDAGCGEDLIRQFVRLWEDGRRREGLNLLGKHRQVLLDRCHAEERRIGCLDYLTYQIENDQI